MNIYIIYSKISKTNVCCECFKTKSQALLCLRDIKNGIKMRSDAYKHLIIKKFTGKEKNITEKQYIKETNFKKYLINNK